MLGLIKWNMHNSYKKYLNVHDNRQSLLTGKKSEKIVQFTAHMHQQLKAYSSFALAATIIHNYLALCTSGVIMLKERKTRNCLKKIMQY